MFLHDGHKRVFGRLWAVLLCTLFVGIRASERNSTCLDPGCSKSSSSTQRRSLSKTSCNQKEYPASGALQPVTLQTAVRNVHWMGAAHERNKYVFTLTEGYKSLYGGTVWRSDNYGKPGSFRDVTDNLEGSTLPSQGVVEGYSGVVQMHQHRFVPEKLLFQGAGKHNWITEDYGESYRAVETPGQTVGAFQHLRLHPNKPDWILAMARRTDCTTYFSRCPKDLFVSQDFGETWTNLTANSQGMILSFIDFDWGANMHRRTRRDVVDQTILATAYEAAAKKEPYAGWDNDVHLVISHDFFGSQHQKVVSCGNQFEIVGDKVYLALPTTCPQFPDGGKRDVCKEPMRGSVIMYVSDDEAQTFTQACVPAQDFDLSYSMLKSHSGEGSFLMIDHDEEEWAASAAPISNVYAAGEGSALFSLSLPRVFQRGVVDFSRVEGLPGVFLANQLAPEALEEQHAFEYLRWISTKISLNGGADWQDLKPPQEFRHADCDLCKGMDDPSKCRLHLHGPANFYSGPGSRPSFYSHFSAPGVVMATGNVGEFLDVSAGSACTWISSDGGLTWQDIAPRANVYEFGDQGGVILLATYETDQPAERLFFSLDQGACWHSIKLAEALDVRNIWVEPSASAKSFVVHGSACKKQEAFPTCTHQSGSSIPGKMYVVDIGDVMGADFQVCGSDDYERWSAPTPEQCLLGRNYTIHRRKPSVACFNTEGWERPENSSEPCPCQAADVGCEFGYEWNGSECSPMAGISADQCPALKQKKYIVSETKKRLVQGDICGNLERVIPDTDGKGNLPRPSGRSGRVAAWIFGTLGLVAVLGGCFFCLRLFQAQRQTGNYGALCSDLDLREQVIGAVMAASECVQNSYAALKERVTGRRQGFEREGEYFEPLPGSEEFALSLNEEHARSPPILNHR